MRDFFLAMVRSSDAMPNVFFFNCPQSQNSPSFSIDTDEGKDKIGRRMDRGKRAEGWPPTAAEIKKTKKQCCDCDHPPTATTGGSSGTVPDEGLSSLFSSLSVAKRHRPSAADDHHHHALKRPRHHAQPLHDQMRGLEISCDETDMEEESSSVRPPHCRDDVDWSGFLPEMLWLICRRLPLADVPRFASVCKHWSSCAFPVYRADAAPVLLSTVVTGAGSVRCYHPDLHKMFVLATPPQTQGCRVFSADSSGCLMLRTARKTVMFVNLLDDDAGGSSVFETPQRENDEGFMLCAPPEQQHGNGDRPYDRRIFSVYPEMGNVRIQSWDGGSWKSFHGGGFFRMSHSCNPVMHKGKLYCLGEEGDLGVYDPIKTRWRVLPKPSGFAPGIPYKNCYLVQSEGELLAALTGSNGTPVHVLKLDEKNMKWKMVKSLGGRALFTGTTSSLSMASPLQAMANKVYLPKFYGRPQVIQAELASSGGRLFFVAKDREAMWKEDANSSGSAWCCDLESASSGEGLAGGSCKSLLQYMWVHLGNSASPTSDDGMVIG
ncbi:unnamed protein product [Alopecurus aequalis]